MNENKKELALFFWRSLAICLFAVLLGIVVTAGVHKIQDASFSRGYNLGFSQGKTSIIDFIVGAPCSPSFQFVSSDWRLRVFHADDCKGNYTWPIIILKNWSVQPSTKIYYKQLN